MQYLIYRKVVNVSTVKGEIFDMRWKGFTKSARKRN